MGAKSFLTFRYPFIMHVFGKIGSGSETSVSSLVVFKGG